MSDKEVDSGNNYDAALAKLTHQIRQARLQAALAVNRELVLLYWNIGQEILTRQHTDGWGAKVIDRLSVDLRAEYPDMTGLSTRNLKYMRAFADAWTDIEFVQQVVAQLPWGHNIRLIQSVKKPEERAWYAQQVIEHGWSRAVLTHQISSDLYSRQGAALTNFNHTLPATQSELAQQLVKDPYSFDFLSLGADMLERDLERGLIDHLSSTILELGKGFAFVGQQYHLEVAGQDYYVDLLFYHLRLRSMVAIELKVEEFRPEFAGKMNFYLSAIDDQLRHQDDNPSIGIILCQNRNETVVEYALRDTRKPMGVARYTVSNALPHELQRELPTLEELAADFPALPVVKLRMEIERVLKVRLNNLTPSGSRPGNIIAGVRALIAQDAAPPSSDDFLDILGVLNQVAHGMDIEPTVIEHAVKISNLFLTELTLT